MAEINLPSIGQQLLTSYAQVLDADRNPKYSLLTLDGSTFDENIYVELFALLGTNILPNRDSGDSRIPYKIVGDLV